MSTSLGMMSWKAVQMSRMATSDVRALADRTEAIVPIA